MAKDAQEKGDIKLPKQFEEDIRPDLIKRAVLAIQTNNKIRYGADPEAGKRASANLSKRRRKYRGMYGRGISRTPRKVLTRRGTQMYQVGAFAPNTVGGRAAHAPKASKSWEQKINKKENRKAIRSALAASVDVEMIKERGHKVPEKFPFIIEDGFESMNKTLDIKNALKSLGFEEEIKRADKKTVRAGKGKSRGRKYKKIKSLLFVTSKPCELEKAARNLSGVDVVEIKNVNTEMLAPGAVPGRLVLFTESAVKSLGENKLFM